MRILVIFLFLWTINVCKGSGPTLKTKSCLALAEFIRSQDELGLGDIQETLTAVKRIKTWISPMTSPAYEPVFVSSDSSYANQRKAASRLRGIEVFSLKMGEGNDSLHEENATMAISIEGVDGIETFFAELQSAHWPSHSYPVGILLNASEAVTVGAMGYEIMPHSPTGQLLSTISAGAWFVARELKQFDFKYPKFEKFVTQNLQMSYESSDVVWALYGQQLKLNKHEKNIRMKTEPDLTNQYKHWTTADGANRDSISMALIDRVIDDKVNTIYVDLLFSASAGTPRLDLILRTTPLPPKPGKRKKSLYEELKELLSRPALSPSKVPSH